LLLLHRETPFPVVRMRESFTISPDAVIEPPKREASNRETCSIRRDSCRGTAGGMVAHEMGIFPRCVASGMTRRLVRCAVTAPKGGSYAWIVGSSSPPHAS
jgi:hypothetical protein